MKLFGLLRKPDWESKDASVRLRAVQSSQDPGLVARLPELLQTDPDPAVRIAALRRVDDPVLLERRLRGELDSNVAAAARRRLGDCLCSAVITFETGSAVLLQTHDAELLALVAEHCPLSALRRIALERCEKPGLLVQRCIHDPDPELRLWLLGRIDASDALRRIADASRKRDKRLTRAARDKLEAQQLAAGDSDALQRRALALCEAFGQIGRELPDDRELRIATLRDEWSELRERVSSDLQRRTDGALSMAEAALGAARGEPITRPDVDAGAAPVDVEPVAETPAAVEVVDSPDPAIEQLLREVPAPDAADLAERIAAIEQQARELPAGASRLRQAQHQRLQDALRDVAGQRRNADERQRLADAEARLSILESALQDGSVSVARDAREALGTSVPRTLQRRLAAADERLAKLERWQRWSGSKVRQRLCDEAEAARASGVHPDALANKIKELKAEWARLDALDGPAAPAPEHGLSRRFRALCHQALAPARPYFEKRRELRGERSGQIAEVLQAAAQLPSTVDALVNLRKRLRDCFPELESAAPEMRGEHGRQLRERLAAIDDALKALREEAALGKQRLVARLRRDLGSADASTAIELAKRAQADWKRLPRAERSVEDALWADLRGLIDPLFARVREQEEAARNEAQASQAAAQAVLDEIEALATAGQERLLHAAAHLESLQQRWRALAPDATTDADAAARHHEGARGASSQRGARREPQRAVARRALPLDARFDAAYRRVQAAQQAAERQRDRGELQAICAAGLLLSAYPQADEQRRDMLRAEFEQLALASDARALLAEHLRSDHGSSGADTAGADVAADLQAVRAELDAGIDSPADSATTRRSEQMQRLAAKLGGHLLEDPRRRIRQRLLDLQALPAVSDLQRQRCAERILRAFDALERA